MSGRIRLATTKYAHSSLFRVNKPRVTAAHLSTQIKENGLSKIPHCTYSPDSNYPKKFSSINDISNPQGFFVKPNNDKLLEAIHDQTYIMITGHHCDKSSTIWKTLYNELEGYEPLMISLKEVDTTTVESFWISLGDSIKTMWKWPSNLLNIVDKTSFLNFFHYYKGKRIILFVDEFDRLQQNELALGHFYSALKAMKERSLRPSVYGLQTIVAIGPPIIYSSSKQAVLNPFNTEFTIQS